MKTVYYFFAIATIFSILKIGMSRSPIHSIAWVVLAFISASSNLILIGLEFIPLILMIVYVGALTIIYVFVVMLIDYKKVKKEEKLLTAPFVYFTTSSLGIFIGLRSNPAFATFFWGTNISAETVSIGSCIYNEYCWPLIIMTLILLIGLVGSLVICFETIVGKFIMEKSWTAEEKATWVIYRSRFLKLVLVLFLTWVTWQIICFIW